MTFYEIYSAIANHVVSGEGIINTRVPIDQIKEEVHNLRKVLLLESEGKSGFNLRDWVVQITLQLEEDCEDGRKKADIPRIYQFKKKNKTYAVNYAGKADMERSLRVIGLNEYRFSKHDERLMGTHECCVINAGKLFVEEDYPDLELVLDAVFLDLNQVQEYETEYDEKFSEYPTDPGLHNTIIEKLINRYVQMYFRMRAIQANTGADLQGLQPGR